MNTAESAERQQLVEKINKYSVNSDIEPDVLTELLKTNFEKPITKQILHGYNMARKNPYGMTHLKMGEYLDILHETGVISNADGKTVFNWKKHSQEMNRLSTNYNAVLNILYSSQMENQDGNLMKVNPDTGWVANKLALVYSGSQKI